MPIGLNPEGVAGNKNLEAGGIPPWGIAP